ncbi:MAG: mechanosensitive ion channel [Candidatus Omnitrophica bacterium]|nr:mechanosensitive ion channel [Candidatus Omnitrophota bacterium]
MKFLRFFFIFYLVSHFSFALAEEKTEPIPADQVKASFEKSLEVVQKTINSDKNKKDSVDIAAEKKEFLKRLTVIIEQKLSLLGKAEVPLQVLDGEIQKITKRSATLEGEKNRTTAKIGVYEQRANSLEQDISLKKQILQLEEGKNDLIIKEIASANEQLDKARYRLDYLNQHLELVNLKISLVRDYAQLLHKMRKRALKKVLLTPSKIHLGKKEAAGLAVVFLLFVAGLVFRRRVIDALEKIARGNHDFIWLSRVLILAGFLYYTAYWALSCFGYHLLLRYITKRVLFSAGIVVLAIATYVLVTALVRHFWVKPTISELTGQKSKHPYFHIFCTLLGVGALVFVVYWVFEIWGAGSVGRKALWHLMQKPFFEAGEMRLSVWLIIKVIILMWLFVTLSKMLDSFLHRRIYPATHLDKTIQYAFSVVIKYLAIIVAAFTALKLLGVEIGALTVLAGTVGLGVGFGLQDLAKNFISGLVMLVERPVKIGDLIEVGGLPGRVRSINARSTVVDTSDNIAVVVPNAEFMSRSVINWSYSDWITRMPLKVAVAYGSDLEFVKKTLIEIALSHSKVLKTPPPAVTLEEFGEHAIIFNLEVWTEDPDVRKEVRSEINFMIEKVFRDKNIKIPFPKQDPHGKAATAPSN